MKKELEIDPYVLFKNIKKIRILAGLTQKELAEKVGVSGKTISAYETGRALPPLPVLVKITEATGKRLEDLIGDEKSFNFSDTEKKIENLEERVSNLEQLIIKYFKKVK